MAAAISLEIERLTHDGRGVGHYLGKTIFVEQAVPGDLLSVKVFAEHPQYDEASILEIQQPSTDRRQPFCPHYGICGGCQLQHINLDAQHHWKWRQFQTDLTKNVAMKHCELVAPIVGSEQGYRRRARFVVGRNKSDKLPKMGFRTLGGNEIVDIDQCPMLTPALNASLANKRPAYLEMASRNLKEISVVDVDSGVYWSDTDEALGTTPFYTLENLKLSFPVSGFVQVNAEINQKMVEQAMTWLALEPQHQVLDAFCGVGNFTLAIAKRLSSSQGKIIGVEGEAELVKMARQNAEDNDLPNAHYHQADLFHSVTDLPWFRKQRYNRVLLDPGRQGAFAFCKVLGQLKPERIVYVSCNTATLVRDLKELTQQGYRIKKATLLDMFPNTAHSEAMVLLVKSAKPTQKRNIGIFKL